MNISIADKKKKSSKSKGGLWGLLFLGVIIAGSFYWWQQTEIQKEINTLNTSIGNIKAQLHEKQGERSIKNIAESQRILSEAQEYRINWSNIMQNLLVYEANGITFESFSISTEKNIAANSKAQNLQQIKQFINTLKGNEKIHQPFVSSISEQEDNTINFQLSFQFIE